ncbi:MFS transporter [Kutzneria viridogrisea]|uniref:DHA2 family multidrug resistance protein-like MFS transporter n=2 Tax=Kutzneria TaxID=43356 RepID=A0ABR6BLN4_9PSEU|nr:MFS transporter [Kutzneria albida]AHH94862.1 putative drug resistance transporter [Kutzneria albida DSM 43870]MBA8927794.1 DHA2 family multidrug resistance protein-like MFS transporter [Kutzneria viridogrisea]
MSQNPPTSGRRQWIGLTVLLLPCLLIAMNMTVLVYALPFISADLAPTAAQQLWIMDIYSFVLAGLLVAMGTLGDRVGRRRLMLIGAATFAAASVLGAFSTSPTMLIISRAVLGLAGAVLEPSTLSLIRAMFHDPRQRTVAISVWTAGLSAGALLGPLLGGVLLEHLPWGSVFLINVPFMLLLLVIAPLLVPEYKAANPGRFDLPSAALSLLAVLPVIFGIKQVAEGGLGPAAIAGIVVGLGFGAVFMHRQRRIEHPMIDLRLFRAPAFSVSVLVNLFALFTMTGFGLYTAQYLQLVVGLSPLQAGLWALPAIGAMIASASMTALFVRWTRPGYVLGAGVGLGAVGLALMTGTGAEPSHGLVVVVLGAAVMQLGLGVVLTLASDMIISTAPPERAGAAAGLAQTGQEFGGALGIAVLGSIGSAVYLAQLPADVTGEARETLGGAVAVAARLGGEAATRLLEVARAAFVSGMQWSALVAAAVLAVLAVAATVLLRRVEADRGQDEKAAV